MDESEPNTFAEWLFYRFSQHNKGDGGAAWQALPQEDRLYWQHEADAVERACKRGGFKRG